MCGIVGILGTPYAAKESYLGLLMLQHRGQDSAGILTYDTQSNSFNLEKNLGRIDQAISEDTINSMPGDCAIAHTRYSTIGTIRKEEIQPMLVSYPYGIGMAHNGNLLNVDTIKEDLLLKNKRLVLSKNDLEIMIHLFAEKLSTEDQDLDFSHLSRAVKEIYNKVQGAYSTVSIIAGYGLVAFKDPKALRPLVWGKRELTKEEKDLNNSDLEFSYAVASESKSLNFLGYDEIKELKQGELLYISTEGKIHLKQLGEEKANPCMFEWIYFANADSNIWDKSVYQKRLNFGELLGEDLRSKNLTFDIVVPVPDTSRPSAITISEKLNLPYREVLIKNRFSQRTFMLNSQSAREKAVHLKLNVVKEEIIGKDVLLVDDSIVRGTTSKRIIQLLKDNGAKSVCIASTCPPIIHPCYFGIDFPDQNNLIAANKNHYEIADYIGADAVYYLSIEDLKKAFAQLNTCMACLDGEYPIDISAANKMISSRIKNEKVNLPRFC